MVRPPVQALAHRAGSGRERRSYPAHRLLDVSRRDVEVRHEPEEIGLRPRCATEDAHFAEARRELGEEALPYHKFADLVKNQVNKLRESGSPEVAFRVAVKDGKVNFTARALKGVQD